MNGKARYLYSELALAVQARRNCDERKPERNAEWFDRWTERISLLTDLLPHGSGFDNGCKVDLDVSHAEKLVLITAFHHMNESGMYDAWTPRRLPCRCGAFWVYLLIAEQQANSV